MLLPRILQLTSTEIIQLPSGGVLTVPKCTPQFLPWGGDPVGDTYNGKQVLDFARQPAFAELAILWALREAGWDGVWIDTYGRSFRTGYWGVPPLPSLPEQPAELLAAIYDRGGSKDGAWDVFCWTQKNFPFAESKRRKKDSIRKSQQAWLEAALALGMKAENFLVVEWSLIASRAAVEGDLDFGHRGTTVKARWRESLNGGWRRYRLEKGLARRLAR